MSTYRGPSLVEEFGNTAPPVTPAPSRRSGSSPLLRQTIGLAVIILLAGGIFLASHIITHRPAQTGSLTISLNGKCDRARTSDCYAAATGIRRQNFIDAISHLDAQRQLPISAFVHTNTRSRQD